LQYFPQIKFGIQFYIYEKYGYKIISKKNGPEMPSEQDFAAKLGQLAEKSDTAALNVHKKCHKFVNTFE